MLPAIAAERKKPGQDFRPDRAFSVEPPKGIEPLTYSLHGRGFDVLDRRTIPDPRRPLGQRRGRSEVVSELQRRRDLARLTKGQLIDLLIRADREIAYLATGEYEEEADRPNGSAER
ncbi:hypothetical protein ABE10_31620 [Bacillus toyonensis]|nr:hypothetical protein [Bacillus toyonensis]